MDETLDPIDVILRRSALGDVDALQQLEARLSPEIRRVARTRLAQGGDTGGLNTTAVINEGLLRLADLQGLQGEARGQFFAFVGQVLRSVVIDHLRATARQAKGDALAPPDADAAELLAVDHALRRMRDLDPASHQLLEMHLFAGVGPAEIADLRRVTPRVVDRDLSKARLLLRQLRG